MREFILRRQELHDSNHRRNANRYCRTPAAIPVHGMVDVSDGLGYLRTAGYRRSAADIPLTPGQPRQYGLRKGDQIEGTACNLATPASSRTLTGGVAASALPHPGSSPARRAASRKAAR
jgi:transcription termination factor Rho